MRNLYIIVATLLVGCSATVPPSGDDDSRAVLRRLEERRDTISSALYRVRWRAVGTEPHAEFILEIAFKAPERYRIVATGPFGLPAFTAVIVGDDFTFVNHRDGRFITDEIAHLIDYQFPVAEFFEGPWRDLFGGGWGGSQEVTVFNRRDGDNQFFAHEGQTDWVISWNRRADGPRRVSATVQRDAGILSADVWFHKYNSSPPFWNMERLVLKGAKDEGEHRWRILSQKYNPEIPDRFFEHLQPPPDWQRFD